MARLPRIFFRVLIGLLFLVLTLAGAAFLYPQQALTVDSGEVKGDVLVVLGGGDGRAERAAELYQQGAAPRVLCTGFGDCDSNIGVLEKQGVPAAAIGAEPNSLSTFQNAQLSIPLLRQMGAHRIILVTSWYHSRRALAVFTHAAPDLQFVSRPCYLGYEPKKRNREGFSDHVNIEYLKMIDYWVSYGVSPF